jgi:hypothetical protein
LISSIMTITRPRSDVVNIQCVIYKVSQLPLPATLQRVEERACMSLIIISDHLMRMGD